jgi:uncharacterized repeat protein (TIGR01451 family)
VFNPTCTVNLQDGWRSAKPGDIPSLPQGYDQQVVVNNASAPATFAGQSLRLSNGWNQNPGTPTNPNPAEFKFQTYSKPTIDPAGEGLANTEYIAQFSFISTKPSAQQPGLSISVSPDDGVGGRMSYVELDDVNDPKIGNGIDVVFYDTKANGDFVGYDLGVLPRDVPHTITFWMKLNSGANNDLVRIYIDGKDAGECFTTWEGFYRSVSQPVPISDTLQFRSVGDQENDSLIGGGYLFDNVKIETADGPGPPGCDVPIDKLADAPTVSAGGLAGYRLTVHNRGKLTERDLLLCDHIPNHTTFVSATRKLRRIGKRRCLFIPSLRPGKSTSVHVTLRVNANAPPGTLDNVADITPDLPLTLPPLAPPLVPANVFPDLPGKVTAIQTAIRRVTSIVRILRARSTVPPPPVTG